MVDKGVHEGRTRGFSLNLPNVLTILRLILVPVFIVLMYLGTIQARWWALLVFCVAAFTDHLDGRIARARGLVTDFGKIADPIADKALTLGAFLMLSVEHPALWLATLPIALRELGITWWRAELLKKGIVVAANSGGKLKTILQMLAITLLLVPWGELVREGDPFVLVAQIGFTCGWVVACAALVVTVWSGWVYIAEGRRLEKTNQAQS